MTQTLAKPDGAQVLESVIIQGDLSKLSPAQRVEYYGKVCESLQLNPFTSPFEYIVLNGKLRLYAKKDATDQLRNLRGVSITGLERSVVGDLYVVVAHARDTAGREDSDMGAVSIAGLKGEALANAMLKAVTKAKRRVTLSLCGLGMTDESEVESIPGAYYPEPSMTPPNDVSAAQPTREREVDDRDMVRDANDKLVQRWLQLVSDADDLGMEAPELDLPVARAALTRMGKELSRAIAQRQEQLDQDRAEAARQQEHEGLTV